MGFELNTKDAMKDFDTYSQKVKSELSIHLTQTAFLMASTQYSILRNRVKKWTGKLAGSIVPRRKNKLTYEIGPIKRRVVYANWIEYGGGSFKGYQYVQKSVQKHKEKYLRKIKTIIERQ